MLAVLVLGEAPMAEDSLRAVPRLPAEGLTWEAALGVRCEKLECWCLWAVLQ